MKENRSNSRRKFIGALAAGSAAGLTALTNPLAAYAEGATTTADGSDEWFKKSKAKHKIIYDSPEPYNGFAFIWSWVYYLTNNQTGSPDSDVTAMVVLRHESIPFAMNNELWKKYNFGKVFNITDSKTSEPSVRNLYYEPQDGDFPVPQIQGIKDLQGRGAMFCVCDMAITVYSSMIAQNMNLDPAEVKKEWVAGVLPDIKVVPSGVWAVGRAQENGFAYCFAGG